MQKLSILAIGHSYVVSLNRAVFREVAQDERFDVTVVAPKKFAGSLRDMTFEREPEGSALKTLPVDVRFSKKIHFFTYDQSQLKEILSEGNYDYLFLWEEPYIFSGYQVARLAKKMGIPFCFYTFQNIRKRYPLPFGWLEKRVYEDCNQWVAAGKLVWDVFLQKGLPPEKGRVLPLFVETSRFKPISPDAKRLLKSELGFSENQPLIGMLARLTEEKGFDVLFSALDQLADEKWNLFLMGSGPYKTEIEEMIKRRGWQGRVKIQLLKHDEVPNYLPAMDLLVAPSQTRGNWKEQFGRMLVESFASGVPVIGSDSGEIPYVIGEAGFVVGEGDVDSWAQKIRELLLNEALRQEFVDKGLVRVKNFSMENIAEQFKAFFLETK